MTPQLLAALIMVESSGRDHVVGDGGHARGPLQIHAAVIRDVNRIHGTHYTHQQMTNRADACRVCTLYLSTYATRERLGHTPTDEDRARIWNGGPEGWRRPTTLGYWSRVRRRL